MRSIAFVAGLVGLFLLLTASTSADDDLARDSASLVQLRDGVRKALQAGWRAEITPDIPSTVVVNNRHQGCRMLIWHEQKVLGKWEGANPPAGDDEDELHFELVTPTIDLMVTKRFTPQEYASAADENIDRARKRLEFAQQLRQLVGLRGIGPDPAPPWSYKPQTEEQKELVRQYALLWTQTERQPLPTHYYEKLSLDIWFYDHLTLKDPQVAEDRDAIKSAILRLVTAYPKRRPPIGR